MRQALFLILATVFAAGCASTQQPVTEPADLAARLRRAENVDDRMSVYTALAAIGPGAAEAVPALIERLRHGDVKDRFGSMIALRSIGPGAREAVPALIGILDQDLGYPPLRTTAAETLGAIGPGAHDAVPALAEGLRAEDRSRTFEPAAKEALRRILEL